MKLLSKIAALVVAMISVVAAPVMASPLQCVPYARAHSEIDLYGNAATWWSQAQGLYARGQTPRTGSVLVFKATGSMPVGHVAVVRKIVDDRHVMLDHANWSRPGMIETSALAEDVSIGGDWSSVRVWYAPTRSLGLRVSPAFGFIYAPGAQTPETRSISLASKQFDAAFADFSMRD